MPIKEIEVKAKVNNKEALISAFKKEGIEFGEEVFQEDRVFINYDGPYKNFQKGATFLRIRITKDKTLFTLKQPQGGADCLSKIEKELEISDSKMMSEICNILGFKEAVVTKKKRRKAKTENYEICLDEVEGLGTFIEVEKMSDEEDETVYKELFSFLEKFGVKKEDRVFVGYDVLMAEKMRI